MTHKLIRVSENTHSELIKRAKYGESMDDIIVDLLQLARKEKAK
jgi:hypothetical protein